MKSRLQTRLKRAEVVTTQVCCTEAGLLLPPFVCMRPALSSLQHHSLPFPHATLAHLTHLHFLPDTWRPLSSQPLHQRQMMTPESKGQKL